MSLQDLEKDLQRRDSTVSHREHEHTTYDVWEPRNKPTQENAPQTNGWQKIRDRMQETRVKAIVYGGMAVFILLFVLGVLAAFLYFQKGFFDQERVTLTMEAPQNVNSNKLTELTFHFENDNRAQLNNAEIVVYFGKYFVPEENQDHFTRVSDGQGVIAIGKIAGNTSDSITLVGHFAGPQGSVDDVAGTLRYVPERTTARFETDARAAVMITSSSVKIDIQAPLEVVSGNLLDVGFVVQNTSGEALNDLKFTVEAPKSFSFFNATPSPNYGTVWLIDTIPAHGEIIIRMRGGLNAEVGSVQTFNAAVRTQDSGEQSVEYAQNTYTPRMISSPIVVRQEFNDPDGIVYAGELMSYTVHFQNAGSTPLRDAIIVVKLDEHVLDLASLDLKDGGDYDQKEKTITWKASDVPALKVIVPGASGKVTFSVAVLEQLPVQNEQDFHYSVSTVASIDSADTPSELRENKTVLSNMLTVPIGAKVIVTPTMQYKDGSQSLRVGEKTRYTTTFSVGSVNNDLANVRLVIALPTHIKYESEKIDGVTFNERTNELTWDIGTVEHGSGVVRDAYTMSYDSSIVPSVDQINAMPVVINHYALTGVDAFTKKDIVIAHSEMTTSNSGMEILDGTVH